jgi:Ca2+-binding EF-hand superfamily protein
MSQFLQEHDMNKDGSLDKSELPGRLRDRFDNLDLNKDGKLTQEELEKGINFLQPNRRPADVLVVLIEMSDCDECCLEELQHFYSTLRKLDRDNDGKLSAEELAAARKAMTEERVNNLIKDLDRDGNGRLSREEARGRVRKDFDKLDANQDGSVDREELLRAAANSAAPAKPTARPDGR